ncbi:MAG: hypothetical protein JXP36_17980 [Bacteroidales bacterium]|nr:hypothetical protein [Bacteroidales bacterium]
MKTKNLSIRIITTCIIISMSSCKTYQSALYQHENTNDITFSDVSIDSLSIYHELYFLKDYFLEIEKGSYGGIAVRRKYGYMFDKKELKKVDTLSNNEFCKILDEYFITYEITKNNRIKILDKPAGSFYKMGIVGNKDGTVYVSNIYESKKIVYDVLSIFSEYLKTYKGVSTSENLPYKIKLGISNYECSVNSIYTVPSVLTLTLINLFGFPIATQKAEIAIDAVIFNNENQVIKEYSFKGSAQKAAAYYWGYTGTGAINKEGQHDLQRVTLTYAIKDALIKLDKALETDY